MAEGGLYRGKEPREMPAYGITEAAHYLRLPPSTLRSWVRGRHYPTEAGQRYSDPLIRLADSTNQSPPYLSFINLIEANVLWALRRHHKITMPKVRQALNYLEAQFPQSEHPLAEHTFATYGKHLFIEYYSQLIEIGKPEQLVMQQVIEDHLSRVEWDETGLPALFYPFARDIHAQDKKIIVIDPRVSFGRPVLVGTGIVTSIIAERFNAGESMDDLAQDYGRSRLEIEEAVRCENLLSRAA